MRKRPAAIVAGLLVWLLLCSNALAVTLDINVGGKEVYAKGNSVTVEASGSSGDKTVVTADDNSTVTYNRLDGGGTMSGDTDVSGYTIYGGSKNADVTGNTSVTVNGGTTGDVYGGGKNGDVNGNTNVTINGGKVEGDVYGGGHATVSGNQTETANVTGNASVAVSNGTVNGDVYGGGNAEARDGETILGLGSKQTAQATANAQSTNVEVGEDGTVTGDVYGGGTATANQNSQKHTSAATANVTQGTDVAVEGETGDVYGGGKSQVNGLAILTTPSTATADVGSTTVTVTGETGNVHGGGNRGNVNGSTKVTVDNAEVTGSVYGGGNNGNVGSTSVTVKNSTVSGSVYGGGRSGNVQGMAKVSIVDGTISDSVYGGGYAGYVQGLAQVEISNGTISGSVYGGGHAGNVAQSNVIISGENTQINNVYGGGHGELLASANAGQTRIELNGGKVGTVYAGSMYNGNVTIGSQIFLNGGSVTTGNVFGWGDGFLFGGSLFTPVTSTQIILSQLSGRDYTFYLPICSDPNAAIVRNGDLRWDGVTGTGISFWDLVLLPYKLTQPADHLVTAITKFIGPSGVVKTVTEPWTIPAGPAVKVTPASWTGDGAYNVGVARPEYQMVDYDDTGDVIFEVPVTLISKDIKVTFKYMYGSETDPRHTDVQWARGVTFESGSQTISSSWDGDVEFDTVGGSQAVNFSSASELVVPIRLTATVKDVTVTFNYTYGGAMKHTENKTAQSLTFESAPQTLTSFWDGGTEFKDASGSKTVDFYSVPNDVVDIQLVPDTRSVMVIFNYLYRGSIVHTEKIPASVTYDGALTSVTPTWDGDGDYIVPEATPVSVGFDYQGEVMTVEITVRRPNNDNNPQVPLGPGTEGNPDIPLGLPRTGDESYSLLSLLVLAGISLAANARKRVK